MAWTRDTNAVRPMSTRLRAPHARGSACQPEVCPAAGLSMPDRIGGVGASDLLRGRAGATGRRSVLGHAGSYARRLFAAGVGCLSSDRPSLDLTARSTNPINDDQVR